MDKEKEQTATLERDFGAPDDGLRVDNGSGSAEDVAGQVEDSTEKLRGQMASKVMEMRMRLRQVLASAGDKDGSPPPQIQDADYLDQDPSTMSGGELADLESRMVNIERDVTSHEAGQVQQEAGKAVGLLAALGAIGGAGELAGSLIDGGQSVSEGALFTPEVDHGIGARGQEQQKDRGAALDL